MGLHSYEAWSEDEWVSDVHRLLPFPESAHSFQDMQLVKKNVEIKRGH